MPRKEYARYEIDDEKETESQYVKIVNPIVLGIQIAVGMFIVFPLFLIVGIIVFLLFSGAIVGIF